MMKVSLIIPTYNRSDTIRQTLSVLLNNSVELPDEIIIVDQTNNQTCFREIKEICCQSTLIKLIHLDFPSLTHARNVGIREATGEILIFMDDDVDVRPDTFRSLKQIFAKNEIAMVAGINEKDGIINANSKFGTLFGCSSYKRRFKGHVTNAVYGRFPIKCIREVDSEWAMGFFFAIRKCIAEKNNIQFDENLKYYAYAEDLDFTYRYYLAAKKMGYKCIVSPEITVRHNVSTEYRTPKRSQDFMKIVHRCYLSNKLFGTAISQLFVIWSNIGEIISSGVLSVRARNLISAQFFCLKNFKQIIHGNMLYEHYM